MRKPALLLLLALTVCLSACGAKPAGEAETATASEEAVVAPSAETTDRQLSSDEQMQILENNRALWAFTEAYESPWFHTFTDLDRNGQLEVIAASTQGSGLYTYVHFYEVRADGSGIGNVYHENAEIEGPDDWPEIVLDSLPCYYDSASDRRYYACEGVARDGYAHQFYAWYALCLKDGTADWEFIASKDVYWSDEGEIASLDCRDAQGNAITEQDYDSAVERRFAGMEKSVLNLSWIQEEIPWEEDVGSGSWLDDPAYASDTADS